MEPITSAQAGVEAFSWLWGYFIPLGLLLLIWGGLEPQRARRVTPLAAMAMALGIVGYWATGFAFHLGGAYAINPNDPALQGLQRLFSIVPGDTGWGLVGMAGFFLTGSSATTAVFRLFLTYLPLIVSAVLLVTLSLAYTHRWIMMVAGLLTGTVVVPVAASWMWGSGWLAHLGRTMDLGQGFVDFGGTTLVLWLPGLVVLPILLLQPRDPTSSPEPPPIHLPLIAHVGALLLGLGWLGWGLSQPFHLSGVTLDWHRTAVNVLLGMAGAVFTSQLYAWLATGEPGALLAAQGLGAGWGVILAGAPFVPSWAALVLGLLGGLLFPLVHYAIQAYLGLRDAAAALALAVTSGPLGVLAVAILADGRWGQGWNASGAVEEVAAAQGVAGIFVSGNVQQLSAQLVGLIAVGLWGLLWGGALGVIASPRLLGSWSDVGLRKLGRRRSKKTLAVPEDVVASADTEVDVSLAASDAVGESISGEDVVVVDAVTDPSSTTDVSDVDRSLSSQLDERDNGVDDSVTTLDEVEETDR